jgi:aminopeptidase
MEDIKNKEFLRSPRNSPEFQGEKEFLKWLEMEEIFKLAKKYSTHFEKIFKQCLDVKDEKILLIGDFGYPTRRVAPLLTGCYYFAAKNLGLNSEIVMQESKRGMDISEPQIAKKLSELPTQSIVILNASGKLGKMQQLGKSFRRFCKTQEHKFVSTTSLSTMDTFMIKSVINALSIDYSEMQKNDKLLKEIIKNGKIMTIKTKAGTDLIIDLKDADVRLADGDYKTYGKGGNLPAGEVYFAPYNVNGTIVIDASSRNREDAVLIQKPITLTIENNKLISIKGEEEAQLLDKSLSQAEELSKYPERIRYLAEVGIGTNKKAKIIGATIIDEKAYGTAHIAIGSNYWFGGSNRTIIHYDQVFKNPLIKIDGIPLRF